MAPGPVQWLLPHLPAVQMTAKPAPRAAAQAWQSSEGAGAAALPGSPADTQLVLPSSPWPAGHCQGDVQLTEPPELPLEPASSSGARLSGTGWDSWGCPTQDQELGVMICVGLFPLVRFYEISPANTPSESRGAAAGEQLWPGQPLAALLPAVMAMLLPKEGGRGLLGPLLLFHSCSLQMLHPSSTSAVSDACSSPGRSCGSCSDKGAMGTFSPSTLGDLGPWCHPGGGQAGR